MYNVLTNREVLNAEEIAITEYGLNQDILIENAAAAICENVSVTATKNTRILVLAGGGKNGADGLSAARKLFLSGYNVSVAMLSDRLCEFTAARLTACQKLGVTVHVDICVEEFDLRGYDFIIDGMVGSGLRASVEGKIKDMIIKLSKSHIYTLSVDIPSGINSDNGTVMGEAVSADLTITFCGARLGHLLNAGRDYCGNLVIASIGIPCNGKIHVVTKAEVTLPKRKIFSHKYNYGKVCIIAGSPNYIGAALLACESAVAALKCGAGLAMLCVPSSLKLAYQQRIKEATILYMPDIDGVVSFDADCLDHIMQKTTAIAIGMGMGNNDDLPKIINYLALNFGGTLVIDADGLNALARDTAILNGHKAKIILTPHMGEFARLYEGSVSDRLTAEIDQVKELALQLNAVVIAKAATSIISDGKDVFLNITGTPAMSKGGSGDVLSGMVAALSCVLSPMQAAITAAYNFGKTGEIAQRCLGSTSVLASDLII